MYSVNGNCFRISVRNLVEFMCAEGDIDNRNTGSAVCDSRWRGVAPTSATPTRSLRKCRRIEEVKSRMDRKFSRIENLCHGTVLALHCCAQNVFPKVVSELLRRKNK